MKFNNIWETSKQLTQGMKKVYHIYLVTKNKFEFLYVIGRGGFGKVKFI